MGFLPNEILKMAVSQGIWATLFVALLFYVLKENGKREEKLQDIIDTLCLKLNVVDDIQRCVIEIKDDLKRR